MDQTTEQYLQANILKPLKMNSTTFYPFGTDFENRLMPLRYGKDAEKGGDISWERLDGHLYLLTLPRT